MKRFAFVALAVAALAFGAAGCEKAHEAGNDSMSAGHSGITASAERPGAVGKTPVAASAAAVDNADTSSVSH
jgi:predicted small secreted protein